MRGPASVLALSQEGGMRLTLADNLVALDDASNDEL